MEIKEDDHNQFDMLEGSFANEFDYGLVEDFSHDARPVNSPIKADCQGKKRMEDYLQWEASLEYFFEMKPMVDLGRCYLLRLTRLNQSTSDEMGVIRLLNLEDTRENALMAGKHVLQDGARRKLSRKSDGIAQRRTRGKNGKALVRFEAGNGIGQNVLSLAATLRFIVSVMVRKALIIVLILLNKE
ncbi:hypothetical protein Goarm_009971 [Gossypium armourianum]|uniref:Uncharacterized protein n=1 Tax=Gossypium armourianum TaxID=34283 RepID=A0A7J9JUL7_9ROSI|nr:hypothetical protein [Gossypium armourianum]